MNQPKPPVSQYKSVRGIRRIFSAVGYSMAGFRAAWRGEHAFRQEVIATIIASSIALALPVSAFYKLILIGVCIQVLIVELLNSAIEAVVDRVSLEHNTLSKNAKDFGSAAVFLSVALAVSTWLVLLLPLAMPLILPLVFPPVSR